MYNLSSADFKSACHPIITNQDLTPADVWARLIQKIYNVNPLLCPKCLGSKGIISFIEDDQLVKKNSQAPGFMGCQTQPPPRANSPPTESFIIYDECSSPGADDYIIDANYRIETYL
jgi:hypothetical protein